MIKDQIGDLHKQLNGIDPKRLDVISGHEHKIQKTLNLFSYNSKEIQMLAIISMVKNFKKYLRNLIILC